MKVQRKINAIQILYFNKAKLTGVKLSNKNKKKLRSNLIKRFFLQLAHERLIEMWNPEMLKSQILHGNALMRRIKGRRSQQEGATLKWPLEVK